MDSSPTRNVDDATSSFTFIIHSSIDPVLAREPSRRAKSQDPGWKYAWWPDLKDKNVLQCLLCGKKTSAGIKRQKEHLIGGYPNTTKCPKTTRDIAGEMLQWIAKSGRSTTKKATSYTDCDIEVQSTKGSNNQNQLQPQGLQHTKKGSSSGSQQIPGKKVGPLDVLCREDLYTFIQERRLRREGSQTILEDHFKKKEKAMVDDIFSDMLYECGIPFNIVNRPIVEVLCEAIGRYGRGYRPPTYHQVRKPLLEKKYEEVMKLKESYEIHWRKYGVTLMTDGWTDQRQRSLVNFLVNCPEGTFYLYSIDTSEKEKTAEYLLELILQAIEHVGVENVIQVCTDNASNYVLAGKMLMEKHNTIYWTPCAAHCFDLVLEDIGKINKFKKVITMGRKITSFIYIHSRLHDAFTKLSNGKELIRCGVTRFATSFLTLQSLYDMKSILKKLFVSDLWNESSWARTEQGKQVMNGVLATNFWDTLESCLKASQPIVALLRLVDSDEKPVMGYISHAFRLAREKIIENFSAKEKDYKPIIDIIDRRWKMHFDLPLLGSGKMLYFYYYYYV
jgi:hypothetical protein